MGKEIPVVARDINVELATSGKPKGKKVLVFVGIEPEQLGDNSKLFSNAPPDLNDFEKQLSAAFVTQLKELESEGAIEIIPILSGDWARIVKVIGEKAVYMSHAVWIDSSNENKAPLQQPLKAFIKSRQIHMLCMHIRSGMSITKLDLPMLEFYLKNRQMFTYGETTIMSIMN